MVLKYLGVRRFFLKIGFSLILFLFAFNKNANSQYELYRTLDGIIQITGILNDSIVIAKSDKLFVLLNYEDASFILKLDLSTLETGIDSLDEKLHALKDKHTIRYEGKLDIDRIQTTSHPAQKFKVTGFMNCAPHYESIIGSGTLDHLMGGPYSCRLSMSFKVNLEDINLKVELPGFLQDIDIEIIKTLLEPEQ